MSPRIWTEEDELFTTIYQFAPLLGGQEHKNYVAPDQVCPPPSNLRSIFVHFSNKKFIIRLPQYPRGVVGR